MVTASHLVLGSAQWGMPYGVANTSGPPDETEVRQMIELACAHGVRTIDTARAYGDSERVIGIAAPSDGIEIATKVHPDVCRGDTSNWNAAMRRSLEESRRALRRDVLDVVLLHRAEQRSLGGGRVWDALREERTVGRVRAIGASATSPDEARDLLAWPGVDAIQVAASVFDRRLLMAGFFDEAKNRGIRVFVRSVFLQGVAHLRTLPAHLSALATAHGQLAAVAGDLGLTVGAVALLYARDHLDAELVVGCERVVQLEENLRVLELPPLDAEAQRIIAAALPPQEPRVLDPSRWIVASASGGA